MSQTSGRSFEDYENDRALQYIVERGFEVIGEALNRLERLDVETAYRLTSIRDIIGFRNRIAHGYDDIRHDVVWVIVSDHLPLLIEEAEALIPAFDPTD
ncbi:MAG: DUF86 domain-containing protein [Thermomicrobiales bacterium]|nr:DUF86 domain-containing protein [Thermomicrobiales bacterium]